MTAELYIAADSDSASHFHLADWLVVLGENVVKYQGTTDDLAQSPEKILKFDPETRSRDDAEKGSRVDKKIRSQELKVADATSDLSRATGDISLYGMCRMWPLPTMTKFVRISRILL